MVHSFRFTDERLPASSNCAPMLRPPLDGCPLSVWVLRASPSSQRGDANCAPRWPSIKRFDRNRHRHGSMKHDRLEQTPFRISPTQQAPRQPLRSWPIGLDWANQPDPFREFHGAAQLKLPLAADSLRTRYNECAVATCRPHADSISISLAILFELSLGLSAWKSYGANALGAALQPFERQSASDRELSAVPAPARPARRGLSLPEPGSCA